MIKLAEAKTARDVALIAKNARRMGQISETQLKTCIAAAEIIRTLGRIRKMQFEGAQLWDEPKGTGANTK